MVISCCVKPENYDPPMILNTLDKIGFFEEIHQELSPVTYNQPRQLDLKQISWLYFARTMKVFPKISYVDQTRIQTSKKLVKTSEKIV